MRVVSGRVVLDGWQGEPGPTTIYVRLLDTSWADDSARIVDEVVLREVRLDEIQEHAFAFFLEASKVDPRARYEVGVLVDLDGDGVTSVGDYRNTVSYPVLTRGFPDEVEVHARRIG